MEEGSVARVYWVDWLRILAVLLLLPYHTLRVFDADNPFYVKAEVLSEEVRGVLSFIEVWHMPLLFFLAGCSTYLALRKRSGGRYSLERVKRLLVPFIFGVLVLIPPQTWYGGRFNSGYEESYWHYLSSGDFLVWNIQDGGDYYGGFGIGQLWFILFLLIISFVALPLVLWGAGGRGKSRVARFSRRIARPVWWIVPVAFLLVGAIAPEIPGGPIVYYLFVFVLGFIAMCDPVFVQRARRYRIPTLAGGVALSLFWVFSGDFRNSLPDPSASRLGLSFVAVLGVWLMLVGLVGFGSRYLDRTSATERYLAEASYPLYILHQTVIVIIAFYMVQSTMPESAEWVLLLLAATLGTFALYEVVRRVGVLRLLFGMRGRTRPSTEAAASLQSSVGQGKGLGPGEASVSVVGVPEEVDEGG